MRRVRIFFCIRIGMMHTMKYSISPWTQVGGTLGNVGEGKKEFLPELIHYKHSVGSIAMQEKCLGKE